MARTTDRNVLREWIGFPLLLIYLGLLIMAAFVGPLRPAWLDSPQKLADRALNAVGILPGITLFRAEDARFPKWRAWCIKVRGDSTRLSGLDLYPVPMGCQKTGLRLRVSPVKLGLDHMLKESWTHHMSTRFETDLATKKAKRDAILIRLGEYFCGGAGETEEDLERISLIWYAYQVDYRNGNEHRGSYLAYDFLCNEGALARQLWFPNETAMAEFWSEEPWE